MLTGDILPEVRGYPVRVKATLKPYSTLPTVADLKAADNVAVAILSSSRGLVSNVIVTITGAKILFLCVVIRS